MKLNQLIALLLLCFSQMQAQEFKLGKVGVAELEEKQHPKDTSAVAAILFKTAKSYFSYKYDKGFSLKHEYTYRIKIYKKEGLSWANFSVPYRIGYETFNNDFVIFSDVITYNLENGNVVKSKLNNGSVMAVKKNEYWKEASIVLPNVKVGSVVEFKYILHSDRIFEFSDVGFQESIPVNYGEYDTEIPLLYTYKTLATGYVKVKTEKKVTKGSQNYVSAHGQSRGFSYNQIQSIYSAEDIPAIKEEQYVNNIENYRTRILHELEKTSFPDKPEKNYSTTWEGVAKSIFEDKNFGRELNKGDLFVNDLKKILLNIDDEYERLRVVYDFVKHKLNWNGKKGVFAEKSVEEAYSEGVGSVAEINFVLYNMLKMSGITVSPVLISTKDNGVPVFPSITGFNYMIVSAQTSNGRILLDATDKLSTLNVLPLRDLNGKGRLINADGTSEEVTMTPITPSLINSTLKFEIQGDGEISGTVVSQRSDYEAFVFRNKIVDISPENYVENLENEMGGVEISDYKVLNEKHDLLKPILESFDFHTNSFVEVIGNSMFVNPFLFFSQKNNPFSQDKREFPVFIDYPKKQRTQITVKLPEGYVVESLPKPLKITMPDNQLKFTLHIVNTENSIQLVIINEVNFTTASPEEYQSLKDFYKKAIEIQNEKIVLKKI